MKNFSIKPIFLFGLRGFITLIIICRLIQSSFSPINPSQCPKEALENGRLDP
jgi:hypothetical protein